MNALQRARAEKGVKQKDVAKALEFSPQYINDVEHGNRLPSLGVALLLAQYYGVEMDELFDMKVIPEKVKE